MHDADPLVLTLVLDAASFARLDALRQRHFPPARNVLRAHLTLFHALPPRHIETIETTLRANAAATPTLRLEATGPRFLGRGVAFGFASEELAGLRRALATSWRPWLTPQDRQGFSAHVTVQNKVSPEAARALLGELQSIEPFPVFGEGLDLWWYRGGPWEHRSRFGFGSPAPTARR